MFSDGREYVCCNTDLLWFKFKVGFIFLYFLIIFFFCKFDSCNCIQNYKSLWASMCTCVPAFVDVFANQFHGNDHYRQIHYNKMKPHHVFVYIRSWLQVEIYITDTSETRLCVVIAAHAESVDSCRGQISQVAAFPVVRRRYCQYPYAYSASKKIKDDEMDILHRVSDKMSIKQIVVVTNALIG